MFYCKKCSYPSHPSNVLSNSSALTDHSRVTSSANAAIADVFCRRWILLTSALSQLTAVR